MTPEQMKQELAVADEWLKEAEAIIREYVERDECCKTPDYDTRVETYPAPEKCTGTYCKACAWLQTVAPE